METIIGTERLELTLLQNGEKESNNFRWMHQLRSDPEATKWSRWGPSKTAEDTVKFMKAILPSPYGEGDGVQYRASYAVHEKSESTDGRFIGLVTVRPGDEPKLPEELEIPTAEKGSTLVVDLGYHFLPQSWGKGFATEAIKAVLDRYRKATSFWAPYRRVYVRAVVDPENPESIRVLEKVGLEKRGTHEWEGERIWLAGGWRECQELVYGMYLA